jgi:glycogen debranching enzyme
MQGSAWIRTNIGHAQVTRTEIIRSVDQQETPLGRDWFDIPMRRVAEGRFEVRLPLTAVGHFEAKCFFLEEGQASPVWPPGVNTALNVEPADACCGNIVYNAFVRQFGPNKAGQATLPPQARECVQTLDAARYTVIPPSGTFRDLAAELDFIVGVLGCRILMLLPIHPTPTTYGRMGRFGSPYAALSFRGVDPALADFDPKATPMEQFAELVDATHRRHARIFLDIAINHTGWAANLHVNHPEWLARTAEGRIEVPGAWGVQWEDLTRLDYAHEELWQFMAEVFLTWCRRGVDGFRCDAGYMVPHAAWRYIVARVREQFPETTFLLEGLGGKISVTRELLNTANLNWAYSELFQNYDRSQIERYLPEANEISATHGITVHFAETHDNLRLAARSRAWARMRTALCALASHQGAFGFANGVEWLATEKINVHEAPSLSWGASPNQVAEIARLSRLLRHHPAFHDRAEVSLVQAGDGNQIVILRRHPPSGKRLVIPVNLDPDRASTAAWTEDGSGRTQATCCDLLTGRPVAVEKRDGVFSCALQPGQVLCLSPDPADLELLGDPAASQAAVPPRVEHQRLRAKALQIVEHFDGTRDLPDFDADAAARELHADPEAYCAGLNRRGSAGRVVAWQWPRDLRREVMIPPGHLLMVRSAFPFHARLADEERSLAVEAGLRSAAGDHFCLMIPPDPAKHLRRLTLHLVVHEEAGSRRATAPLMLLPPGGEARARRIFGRARLLHEPMHFLSTNGRGAMLRIPVAWGELTSRYDALLAANLSPDHPEDRWVMFTRCRAWLVYQGYSQDIALDSLQAFALSEDTRSATWRYKIPSGQGQHVLLTLTAEMLPGRNAVRLTFARRRAGANPSRLADATPVRLILRPDVEDRSFHETTKAFAGPEHHFRAAVTAAASGFEFHPNPRRRLRAAISHGRFFHEPDWQYMVHRSRDEERGQDPHSDLFSPGYFETWLKGGEEVTLTTEINPAESPANVVPPAPEPRKPPSPPVARPIDILTAALGHYVVDRGGLKSVIAGYPWFLDWGRDSLISVRGLVAAGRFADARAVLTLFGQFEERGTLPNMIRGGDAGNRDTSDAPLWFAVACADLAQAEGGKAVYGGDCGGRPVREVLASIVRGYIAGTPNGVRMDPDSGLIYSPSHFTWMDTNYPAGTPRQGFPIEIQALWHAALTTAAAANPKEGRRWRALAERVRDSITTLFRKPTTGGLCDCLHAEPGRPAVAADPDDAVRPNQLFAVSLGVLDPAGPLAKGILESCAELLVPGAIRSLADRPVARPIPVVHNATPLNDPQRPYWGRYTGDEDTRRKPAYHNGTAWTWPFPTYCEAWAACYGSEGRETACAWLTSSIALLESGCLGHLPEILDGDSPHATRGCDAQSWGVSEWVRVWLKLQLPPPPGTD